MPELSAVEHERRYFEETSLDRTIETVALLDDGILEETEAESLVEQLTGRTFDDTARHGKFMFAHVEGDDWLPLHYGMSGTLEHWESDEKVPDYTRLRIDFEDGSHLAYVCMRKLGRVARVESPASVVDDREVGPDVSREDFDWEAFRALLEGRRGYLKSAMMDQQLMAGLGNEHSDEILFQIQVHPKTKAASLGDEKRREAFEALRDSIEVFVEHFPETHALEDDYLMPHRHEGGDCLRCGVELATVQVVGRSSYYCPSCQGSEP